MNPPQGFHDYFPEEEGPRQAMFTVLRSISSAHGFVPWSGPAVEHQRVMEAAQLHHMLHIRSPSSSLSGDGDEHGGSGPVNGDMVGVGEREARKGGKRRPDTVLRPEHTTSLVRLLRQRQNGAGYLRLPLPVQWFTIGPCWRQERTGKGRLKEHTQWNLDVIGDATVNAETVVMSTLFAALHRLGLSPRHLRIHVSSLSMMRAIFACLGVTDPETQTAIFGVLDSRYKIGWPGTLCALRTLVDTEEQVGFVSKLCSPSPVLTTGLLEIASRSDSPSLVSEAAAQIRKFQLLYTCLKSIPTYGRCIVFDPTIARGLHYYTGFVFEGFGISPPSSTMELGVGSSTRTKHMAHALFGGGRYDHSFEKVGSPVPIPAIGVGVGDVRLLAFLREHGLFKHAPLVPDCCVTVEEEQHVPLSTQVAGTLRVLDRLCVTRCAPFKRVASQMAKLGVHLLLVPLSPTSVSAWRLWRGKYTKWKEHVELDSLFA